jgi:hypothetical protein
MPSVGLCNGRGSFARYCKPAAGVTRTNRDDFAPMRFGYPYPPGARFQVGRDRPRDPFQFPAVGAVDFRLLRCRLPSRLLHKPLVRPAGGVGP